MLSEYPFLKRYFWLYHALEYCTSLKKIHYINPTLAYQHSFRVKNVFVQINIHKIQKRILYFEEHTIFRTQNISIFRIYQTPDTVRGMLLNNNLIKKIQTKTLNKNV